jgi:hypothetical protein
MSIAHPKPTADRGPLRVKSLGEAVIRFLGYGSPLILTITALAYLVARPFLGVPGWWDLAIVVVVAIEWPLQEWFLHMTLLHIKPRKILGIKVDPLFAQDHRYHHLHPWDMRATVLPLRVIIPGVPINFGVWYLITQDVGLACTGAGAYTAACLFYEWCHYIAHTTYKPRGKFFRQVRRNHLLHHFRNEGYWHGFSAPWVDSLFGTGPNPRDVSQSSSVRTLGVDPDTGVPLDPS